MACFTTCCNVYVLDMWVPEPVMEELSGSLGTADHTLRDMSCVTGRLKLDDKLSCIAFYSAILYLL